MDRMLSLLENISTYLVTVIIGGVGWLIRRVITNQKQIELLQSELRNRERQREEDRERIARIERGVERIEGWMMDRR